MIEQAELRRLQQIELAILTDFVAVCGRLNLKYFVVGGTGIPPGTREISSVDAVLGSARDILDYLALKMPASVPSAGRGV